MKLQKMITVSGLLFALLVFSQGCFALSPEDLIKDIFAKVGKENLMFNSQLKNEVESHIDFFEMTKAILGQELSKINNTERTWFEVTIKEIITRSVYPAAPKFLENVKITYKKTQDNNDHAKVSSSVSKKGESTDVDYFLIKKGNDWKVLDVAIDEESWVKTINEKVQKTIKEKGWIGLKNLLNKRLKELKSNKNK